MIIRKAVSDDATQIADIWTHYIDHTIATFNTKRHTQQSILDLLREKAVEEHGFFIAEHDRKIIGFATYGAFRAGPGYSRSKEHTVMLHPEIGIKGTGRALMIAVQDHARAGGAHSLIAGVTAENHAGISFHAAIGFVTVATVPEVGYKFDRYHDLVLMQKFL